MLRRAGGARAAAAGLLALAVAAALGLAAWAWRGSATNVGSRLPGFPARSAEPLRLVLRAEGLHWSATIVFLPAPRGEEGALYFAIDLRQRAGPPAVRYRVAATLPFAAYACRRDGPPGVAPPGPWTGPASEGAAPSGVIHLPACRVDLAGRDVGEGFALVRENPLILQIEWQVGSEIRVEVIEARPV